MPKLRFPEFNGEWEEKKLGDICDNKSSKYNPEKKDTNFRCVELEHLSQESGQLLAYCDSKEQNSIKNRFYAGQVLFGKLRPYLKKYWHATFDGVCSTEIWVFNGKEVTNEFLYQMIQTNKFNYIANVSSGSKMPRSDWKYMHHVVFNVPNLPEQRKIASFLSKVDEKIVKLEKKQELWESYKKGMMQQIFSQKLRFKDENGEDYTDWKEKKFSQIFDFVATNSFSRADLNDEKGKVHNIHYGDIHTKFPIILDINKTNIPLINEDVDLSKIKDESYCRNGDLVIADASEDYEDIGKAVELRNIGNKKILAGLHTLLARDESNFTKAGYRSYILLDMKVKLQIKKLATGVSVLGISKNNLGKVELKIPSKPEQEKIADFMSYIESKISHLNNEIKINKEFKKGLLQQMIV